jgi:hypothetical protein
MNKVVMVYYNHNLKTYFELLLVIMFAIIAECILVGGKLC